MPTGAVSNKANGKNFMALEGSSQSEPCHAHLGACFCSGELVKLRGVSLPCSGRRKEGSSPIAFSSLRGPSSTEEFFYSEASDVGSIIRLLKSHVLTVLRSSEFA
jgi:hypothetical protein